MDIAAKLSAWWAQTPTTEIVWLAIGFAAQLLFSMRFIIQWLASERARRSIVPETFWYFSLAGGSLLFAYAIYRMDPVFMLGQGMGLLIYARNIHFIVTGKREDAAAAQASAAAEGKDETAAKA
ncbi:MAG: lipid-A-disaccharide synthase N-terminal domain-containing protein [Hyphomicrobiaceae bacterium]|nr:lipid-A-disaccharide synthase N-terminal domain-containing protein [Hyphomicrobiaceae bacterium]